MTSALIHIAAVVAVMAAIAGPFIECRKGLLPGMVAAVAFGVAAALLLTAARSVG
jgi:hypothetical protein